MNFTTCWNKRPYEFVWSSDGMHNSAFRKLSILKQAGKSHIETITTDLDDDKDSKPNWSSFIYGCFAGILPLAVMGTYFFDTLDGIGKVDEVPQRVKVF